MMVMLIILASVLGSAWLMGFDFNRNGGMTFIILGVLFAWTVSHVAHGMSFVRKNA